MNEKVAENVQQFEFKAEMKQLLNLIIHSLYTHPEVFLRELVSNSSDAINKVRFQKLTDPNIVDADVELKIDLKLDKDSQTFTIEDTGIGMTKEELVNQLGTIASSGTLQFMEQLKDKKEIGKDLIGQFGVGFYSVFMVTDEITVETRHAAEGSKAYKWTSNGESSFTIEETDRTERGTKISFKLKDEYKDFSEDHRIKSVLQKYSNFVEFPIYIGEENINTVTAIWHKRKDEIKDEEITEFYKYISNDFQEPLGHLHLNIEGNINFKAMIFIPAVAPPSFFKDATDKSLQLYSSKVFIQDDAKELLPEYLRFVKGVVDTEDLPLNVSREVTQSSPVMTKIKNILTGKILSLLEEWAKDDKEKYETFYKQFGSLFKSGANSDFSHKDRIVELMRFDSSKTEAGELTSFNAYVSRMKEGEDKSIYYQSGNSRETIEKNPNLEYFHKKDIEVLYLSDPADIFTVPYIQEYDGKKIMSIDKADIDISKDKEDKAEVLNEEESKTMLEYFKEILGDKVEGVIESKRLVDSAVTLVVGDQGMDPTMEKMMQMMDKDFTASKRILEINTSHNLILNLSNLYKDNKENPVIKQSVMQLFEGATLMEGYMKSPSDFVKRMTSFMEQATSSK